MCLFWKLDRRQTKLTDVKMPTKLICKMLQINFFSIIFIHESEHTLCSGKDLRASKYSLKINDSIKEYRKNNFDCFHNLHLRV